MPSKFCVSTHPPELVQVQWSSFSSLTHPLLPTPCFQESRCNCGKFPQRLSRKGKHRWSGMPNSATPLYYVLLSDVFGQQVPDAYGNSDRVYLNTGALRQQIIDSSSLFL